MDLPNQVATGLDSSEKYWIMSWTLIGTPRGAVLAFQEEENYNSQPGGEGAEGLRSLVHARLKRCKRMMEGNQVLDE